MAVTSQELAETRLALNQWERWNSSWMYRKWRCLCSIIESCRKNIKRNWSLELWQVYAIIGVWNRRWNRRQTN